MVFYRGIDHVNTTNDDESVVKITSTEAEKKRIVAVRISSETEEGHMRMWVDRENLFEGNTYHKTAQATIEDFLEFKVDRELAIGESFELTLQNDVADTHAEITGDVVYDII